VARLTSVEDRVQLACPLIVSAIAKDPE